MEVGKAVPAETINILRKNARIVAGMTFFIHKVLFIEFSPSFVLLGTMCAHAFKICYYLKTIKETEKKIIEAFAWA